MPTTVERRSSDTVAFVPPERPSPLLEPLRILFVEDREGGERGESDPEHELPVGAQLYDQPVVEVDDVVAVTSRADAIDRVTRERFDVLIVSLVGPGSVGTGLVSDLALHSPHSALVAVTGSDALDVSIECIRRGATEVISDAGLGPATLANTIALAVERKSVELALRALSISDDLTGLGNRRALDEYVARYRSSEIRTRTHLGFIVIDLDGFKRVNDEHGHLIGDEVLRALGDRLLSLVRATDLIARLGGDEFVVATVSRRKEHIRFLERRLLHEFASRPVEAASARVTAAAGGALMADGESVIEVLDRADQAMYRHKLALRGAELRGADRPRHERPRSD